MQSQTFSLYDSISGSIKYIKTGTIKQYLTAASWDQLLSFGITIFLTLTPIFIGIAIFRILRNNSYTVSKFVIGILIGSKILLNGWYYLRGAQHLEGGYSYINEWKIGYFILLLSLITFIFPGKIAKIFPQSTARSSVSPETVQIGESNQADLAIESPLKDDSLIKFCHSCGNKIEHNKHNFCPYCGTKLLSVKDGA